MPRDGNTKARDGDAAGSMGAEADRPPVELWAKILVACALLAGTALLYHPVREFGFINYDDPFLLEQNRNVNTGLSWNNVVWAFTATDMLQWAPITWLSHMLDFEIFGSDPAGHHVSSLIVHLLNTLLVLSFVNSATGRFWRSAFVAALFAVHPLHVEPVAWLSARKDLVSTALFLVTLICYVRYVQRRRLVDYGLAVAGFALSLMAKPTYVTAPFLLILLDVWPLRRVALETGPRWPAPLRGLGRLLLEKLPFALLAAVFSAVAYHAQSRAHAISELASEHGGSRAALVLLSYAHTLYRSVWPEKLAIVYPIPISVPWWQFLVAAFTLIAISAGAIKWARTRPHLVVGWFWFLAILFPVSGVVTIGSALTADKFAYLPLLGLSVMVAWCAPAAVPSFVPDRLRGVLLAILAMTILAASAVRSSAYLEKWESSRALYTEALSVTEGNFLVMGNLARALRAEGEFDAAMKLFQRSVEVEPRFEPGHSGIGYLWLEKNRCDLAVPSFLKALEANPAYRPAQFGLSYCRQQRAK